jgi:hypothetical protein
MRQTQTSFAAVARVIDLNIALMAGYVLDLETSFGLPQSL